jgi:hypothetical protein
VTSGEWEIVGGGTGDNRVRGVARAFDSDADGIRHDIHIQNGRDWGYTGDAWTELTAFGLLLSRAKLDETRRAARQWLGLSLAEMARQVFAYTCDLTLTEHNVLAVSFGQRSDLILGVGETGCTVKIRNGTLQVETLMVVNPTDLEGFVHGLEAVLRG